MVKKRWKTRHLLTVIAVMNMMAFPALGSSQDWASLKEGFRSIQTVRADFLQKRHLPILKDPLVSEGRLFFDASGSVRWEYLSPLQSVMLQKGDKIQLFHFSEGTWKPDMTQSVEARRMVLAEMSQWFQGRFEESKSFSHDYLPGPPVRIVLTPNEGINRFISRIEILLSEKPGIIERVEIVEPGESRTSIEFLNVAVNSSMPSGIFDKP
jgi:outer membrane lipoprotein-sorting protein